MRLCDDAVRDDVQVADYSRLVLLHLLQSKLMVSREFWTNLMSIVAVLLPQLQVRKARSCSKRGDELGAV